jgi:hypothetical protein
MSKGNIVICITVIVLFTNCRKPKQSDCLDINNPACANYCNDKQKTSAKFKLYDAPATPTIYTLMWQYKLEDTMCKYAYFKLIPDFKPSTEEAGKYIFKWYVNGVYVTSNIMTDNATSYKFQDTFSVNAVTIKLVVYNKNPNTTCHPYDKGIDSSTVTYHNINYWADKFSGIYEGNLTTDPSNTFTVSATMLLNPVPSIGNSWFIQNLPQNSGSGFINSGGNHTASLRSFTFDGMQYVDECLNVAAFIYVDSKQNVTINFHHSTMPGVGGPRSEIKTFIGKQIWRQFP